jgi:hypothetical protein
VVTAAHCIEYGKTQRVYAGLHDIYEKNNSKVQMRNKTLVLKHKKFNLNLSVDNDVGLIRVDPPFELNGTIYFISQLAEVPGVARVFYILLICQ